MVPAIIAVLIMIVMLLLYGAVMLFTDYIKATLYVKAIFINLIWFFMAEGYKGYEIYYPSVFSNKWFNLLLMTLALMLIVFETSKFIKLRNALVISSGTLTHIVLALFVLNFCGADIPGWLTAVYIGVSSSIVFGIHIAAIYTRDNSVPGNFFSRALAGVLMMPAPFLITSACMVASSVNNESVVKIVPFKEFIYDIYNFLIDPKFNFSGNFMFKEINYTRNMLILSLIVSILVFIVYIIVDSTVDYRSEIKEKRKHRKEAEKERIRSEISSRIRSELEKIDSCMSYISSNSKMLKVKEADMKSLRNLYDEATRIKYSYNGAASGPILKRVSEIRTEIYIIKDRMVNHIDLGDENFEDEKQKEFEHGTNENTADDRNSDNSEKTGYAGNGSETGEQNKYENEFRDETDNSERKQIGIHERKEPSTDFFNGCKTSEEIKKLKESAVKK